MKWEEFLSTYRNFFPISDAAKALLKLKAEYKKLTGIDVDKVASGKTKIDSPKTEKRSFPSTDGEKSFGFGKG